MAPLLRRRVERNDHLLWLEEMHEFPEVWLTPTYNLRMPAFPLLSYATSVELDLRWLLTGQLPVNYIHR